MGTSAAIISATSSAAGDAARTADTASTGVVKMCNGMMLQPEHSKAPPTKRRQTDPMSLSALRSQMEEMEAPNTSVRKLPALSSGPSSQQNAHMAIESSSEQPVVRNVKYETLTFAQAVAEQALGGLEGLDGVMTNAARANRKREQEEKRARLQASRGERQAEADKARVDYGLTTKEKKERKDREIKLEGQQFAANQATAGSDFVRRARRVFIANCVAIISQLLFVFEVYQSDDQGRAPAPKFVFIYTMCGITGSVLAQFSVAIISAVLVSQGLNARSLQTICPMSVYLQYLSALLQLLSFFNHLGYVQTFFWRIGDAWPGKNTGFTVVLVAEMVLGPLLPILMVFTIAQTKFMCYINLKKFVPAALIQKHIYRAIGVCQVISSLTVIGVCGLNLSSAFDAVKGIDLIGTQPQVISSLLPAGRPSVPFVKFIPLFLNYMYFLFPLAGCIGLFLGAYYLAVTQSMSVYELDTLQLEENKESALLAGQRVLLTMGTPCKLRHLVDKPSLNGLTGSIVGNGTDELGKLTVNVDGKDVKVEEFQVTVTTDEKELDQIKERAQLRAAETVYNFEERGDKLKQRQMLYVTFAQIVVGLLLVFIILLSIQNEFGAVAAFREVFDRIPGGWGAYGSHSFHVSWQNATLDQIRADQNQGLEYVLEVQRRTCHIWAQCIDGSPALDRPGFTDCGTGLTRCLIPRPASISAESLKRPTFAEGNLFAGTSLAWMIAFVSGGGFIGLIFGLFFMRSVAQTGWATSFCTSLVIALLFGVVTVTASSFSNQLALYNQLPPSVCGSEDIDDSPNVFARVSTNCLKFAAAVEARDTFVVDARLSVTGVLVNMMIFLGESLTNLAKAIQARGPTLWAKFEAEVFFAYFLFVAVCLLVVNNLESDGTLDLIDELYRNTTNFAADLVHNFGSSIPLQVNEKWPFQRQEQIANNLWYEKGGNTIPILASVACVQTVGIMSSYIGSCFTTWFSSDSVWIYTMRYALVIDLLLLISFYGAMIYLSVITVNLVHNIVAVLIIPTNVQFFFAALYAVQSDILPVFHDLPTNAILNYMMRLAYVLPFLCVFIITLGFSYWLFWGFDTGVDPTIPEKTPLSEARSLGLAIMAIGESIMGLLALSAFIFFCCVNNVIFQYYDDWTTMAADKLAQFYPTVFGKRDDDEDEEQAKSPEPAADKPSPAAQTSASADE